MNHQVKIPPLIVAAFSALCVFTACALGACAPASSQTPDSKSDDITTETLNMNRQLSSVVEDGAPLADDVKALIANSAAGYTDDPQVVYQYPELQSGCEIAALASALQACGFNVTATQIADEYLEIDGDYEKGYLASPHTTYGGGFPPGVAKAANAYLAAKHSQLHAHVLTGSTFGGLSALVNAGYPVLVWTTLDNNEPNYDPELGGIEDWYVNEHCITVYGVSDGTVTAVDPLKGLVEIDASALATAYTKCGSMALYIR